MERRNAICSSGMADELFSIEDSSLHRKQCMVLREHSQMYFQKTFGCCLRFGGTDYEVQKAEKFSTKAKCWQPFVIYYA